MPAGMSFAKARRSSKKNANGTNARRKAGLPAKAGKRRPQHIVKGKADRNGKRHYEINTNWKEGVQ